MQVSATLAQEINDILVPVHRDGWKFVGIAAAIALLLFWLIPWLAWIAVAAALWLAYFFRDPRRVSPLRDGLVVAAADGRVAAIEIVTPPDELGIGSALRVRVSTTLSLFDVHINRIPVAGRIQRSLYVPGSFLNPTLDKASAENERRALIIATPSGAEFAVVQIAGLISRRIVTFAGEGDTVGIGQRFGLIRFGSRVDVYLPPGQAALVAVGQRSVAGETVIADLASKEPQREGRRS